MNALADGDREKAMNHFQLAVDTKVATHNAAFYGWSHAFLHRLKTTGEEWPASIQRAATQPAPEKDEDQ